MKLFGSNHRDVETIERDIEQLDEQIEEARETDNENGPGDLVVAKLNRMAERDKAKKAKENSLIDSIL